MPATPRRPLLRAAPRVRPPEPPVRRPARWLGVLLALATTATSCYRYEAREFEITIPEQAESSVVHLEASCDVHAWRARMEMMSKRC